MTRTLTLLIVLAMTTSATLFAQEYHRHLPEDHPSISQAVPSPYGGMFILSDDVVAKFDADGEVEWSKTFGPTRRIAASDDGGIWITELWVDSDGDEPYTEVWELVVRKVDDAGNEVLVHNLRIETPELTMQLFDAADVYAMDDGGFVLANWSGPGNNTTVLLRVHGDGTAGFMTMRWAGDQVWIPYQERIQELEDGSILWIRVYGTPPHPDWLVERIGPDGEDIQRWRIRKTAPGHYMGNSAFLLDSNNDLVIAYSAFSINPSNKWLVAGKWDLEGNMLWNRAYRNSAWAPELAPALGCERTNGNYRLGGLDYVELDTDGELVFETSCSTPTYTDEYIIDHHQFDQVLLPNDEFFYIGRRQWLDALFGFSVNMPLFGRAHIEQDASCLWQCEPPEPFEEVDVPEPLFELLEGPGSFDGLLDDVTFTIAPLVPTGGTDVPFAEVGDACELPEIVQAGLGITPISLWGRALDVHPSPVAQGGTLHFELEEAQMVRVLDASGRLVSTHGLGPVRTHSLSTAGWRSGLYLLQIFGDGMAPLGMQRVVVQ